MKTKASKVRLIVLISILVLIVGGFAVYKIVEYKKSKDPANRPIQSVPHYSLQGKIIEIKSDNTIIVEPISENSSMIFNNTDKVMVAFNEVSAVLYNDEPGSQCEDLSDKYEMQVGDIVETEFCDRDILTEKDGYKYLDQKSNGEGICVYFSDYENRVFSED